MKVANPTQAIAYKKAIESSKISSVGLGSRSYLYLFLISILNLRVGVELFPIFDGNLDVTDSVDSKKETEKIHADVWKSKSASHIAFFILYRLHYRKCCQNKHDF